MPLPSSFHHHFFSDTQTNEQSAEDYTPELVGQFLEEIGLGHHVTAFIEQEICGDMLLEPEEEMLEELKVTSPTERLKIKVQGGVIGGKVGMQSYTARHCPDIIGR